MKFVFTESGAMFSPCRRWRYQLTRRWGSDQEPRRWCMFIGVNPSVANEVQVDRTVRRCLGYARDWGCNGLLMTNLFGLVSQDIDGMLHAAHPVGDENDKWLLASAERAEIIVCAWGTNGTHWGRDQEVLKLLRQYNLNYLRLTDGGHPEHPLYLPATLKPQPLL